MPKFLKILAGGAGLCLLLFIALLISFGGSNTVSLSQQIIAATSLIPPSIQTPNLTEKLTDQLTEEILTNNPDGPLADNGGISLPNANELVAKTLREQMADFDPSELRPFISKENILIAANVGDADRKNYFNNLAKILNFNLSKITFKATNPQPEELSAAGSSYKNAMAELAAVTTPADLVDIQIQTLEMLGTQANTFDLLSRYDQDPLKALLAANIQESIAQESNELQKKVLSYIQEHSLEF